ncbi:hypothetical protein CsSME_00043407 [Camellia sinensis var. sinensis]
MESKPSLLRNILVRLFVFSVLIIAVRFAYVVTIRGESYDLGSFCFFSSPENLNLVIGVQNRRSSAIITNDAINSGGTPWLMILKHPPLHYCPGLEWAYDELRRIQQESTSSSESSYSSERLKSISSPTSCITEHLSCRVLYSCCLTTDIGCVCLLYLICYCWILLVFSFSLSMRAMFVSKQKHTNLCLLHRLSTFAQIFCPGGALHVLRQRQPCNRRPKPRRFPAIGDPHRSSFRPCHRTLGGLRALRVPSLILLPCRQCFFCADTDSLSFIQICSSTTRLCVSVSFLVSGFAPLHNDELSH